MRKITLSLLSLLFAMFLFVACNNPASTDAQENEEPAAVENVETPVLETTDTTAVDVEIDTTVVEEAVEEIVD